MKELLCQATQWHVIQVREALCITALFSSIAPRASSGIVCRVPKVHCSLPCHRAESYTPSFCYRSAWLCYPEHWAFVSENAKSLVLHFVVFLGSVFTQYVRAPILNSVVQRPFDASDTSVWVVNCQNAVDLTVELFGS